MESRVPESAPRTRENRDTCLDEGGSGVTKKRKDAGKKRTGIYGRRFFAGWTKFIFQSIFFIFHQKCIQCSSFKDKVHSFRGKRHFPPLGGRGRWIEITFARNSPNALCGSYQVPRQAADIASFDIPSRTRRNVYRAWYDRVRFISAFFASFFPRWESERQEMLRREFMALGVLIFGGERVDRNF